MTDITITDLLTLLKNNDHDIQFPLHRHVSMRLRRFNGQGESSLFYSNGHTANIVFPTGRFTPGDARSDEDKRLGIMQYLEREAVNNGMNDYFDIMKSLSIGAGIDTALAESFVREIDQIEEIDFKGIYDMMAKKALAWSLTKTTSEASVRNMGLFGCFLEPRYARRCTNLENFYSHTLQISAPVAKETEKALVALTLRVKEYGVE